MFKLDSSQIRTLTEYHDLISVTDDYNPIINPLSNERIILLYENLLDLDTAIANHINEGLKRGQICILASVHIIDKGYIENISSRITDFEQNVKEGNLLFINLIEHYIDVMKGNLEPFDRLKEELIYKAKMDQGRKKDKRHTCLVADCATFLLENKHFDECIQLEEWWHQKPFMLLIYALIQDIC